jgi:hypothetical protein
MAKMDKGKVGDEVAFGVPLREPEKMRDPIKMPGLVQAVIKMPVVFRLHKRGKTVPSISATTGISPATVKAWLAKYRKYAAQITAFIDLIDRRPRS